MKFRPQQTTFRVSRRRLVQLMAVLPWCWALRTGAQPAGPSELRASWATDHFRLDAGGRLWRHDPRQPTAPAVLIAQGPWRQLAVSSDGQYLLVVRDNPSELDVLDHQGRPLQRHAVQSRDGLRPARVSAVVDARARRSFLVALQDLAEIWEISYNPRAEDIYEGLVHDFRMGEGVPIRGFLGVRRIKLREPLAEVIADPIGMHALGVGVAAQATQITAEALHVINLDVKREVARIAVPVTRPLQGHVVFDGQQRLLLVQPHPGGTRLMHVDLEARRWQPVAEVPPVTSAWHGHVGARHLWATVPASANKPGHVLAIDKRTLQVAGEVAAPPAGVSVLALTRDGSQVLLLSPAAGEGERVTIVDEATRELRGSFMLGR